ncbi:hypothetical protein AMTR_s00009p00025930 [Amborella trichopoda]|uniref:Uncharacterized protein n=1 Tax=Amborella trichopoda TaxID=13333 RepID=W1NHZ0_AMBTC|nr:hypothetical protein AMTR_s00009p00025930 [Amborella trichopoda]
MSTRHLQVLPPMVAQTEQVEEYDEIAITLRRTGLPDKHSGKPGLGYMGPTYLPPRPSMADQTTHVVASQDLPPLPCEPLVVEEIFSQATREANVPHGSQET